MAERVNANALPLPLQIPLLSNNSGALPLLLDRPLGKPPIIFRIVSADSLPLQLSRPIVDRPASNNLPLPLSRKLGVLVISGDVNDNNDNIDDSDGSTPTEPPKPRRMHGAMAWFGAVTHTTKTIVRCETWRHTSQSIADDYQVIRDAAINIASRHYFKSQAFVPLLQWQKIQISNGILLKYCQAQTVLPFISLQSCQAAKISPTIGYQSCVAVKSAPVVAYKHCVNLPLKHTINLSDSVSYYKASRNIEKYKQARTSAAIPVPCRYYPIPEPEPDKPNFTCRIRPPANRLPLPLSRRRSNLPSSNLPFVFTCWHDAPPQLIPNLRSYIVHNIITATVGGIAVDPLSFSIKTDMSSYCWQGSIDITAKDYAKIKAKLDVPQGNEPLINVVVNGFTFTIIAEDQSRTRKFANHTHSIGGRSITARLGADYAGTQSGLSDQANYASQIVNQQLNGLSISVQDWDINDWLIPANQYAVTGKTPIAVIADIAQACGGFVTTHPNEPTLSLKPRWKKPAWELATATPDVTIPADVILNMTDTVNKATRFNTVMVVGDTVGHEVFRARQGRDSDAPTQNHTLYTDQDVTVPKGMAILSDSGTHAIYTLKMLWSDDVPLAKLGQIWQVNDTLEGGDGAWRGVVTAISVNIELDNGAPKIYQTVTVDRYLDN
ncbi:hypothetical protein [Psychrobacter sp. I-STPA10]|uniref:hypothetical protein n=1 Tax=Psychrobacter sp. I-STPA10 TaxID=2585769 RepID=UPI001E4114C2|nr:hypothetical protein [Psychrobacter sp. I-STPA10]